MAASDYTNQEGSIETVGPVNIDTVHTCEGLLHVYSLLVVSCERLKVPSPNNLHSVFFFHFLVCLSCVHAQLSE